MKKLLGIFGGTFDPVHLGHLAIAQQLLIDLPFEAIHFIPCFLPVHREQPTVTPQDRLAMLNLAIKPLHQPLLVDDCEIQREDQSYMAETLCALKEKHPENHLALILGYDAWQRFLNWHRYQAILEYAHLILVHRPETPLAETGELAELLKTHQTEDINELLSTPAGKILLQPNHYQDISATAIRNALQNQENTDQLLPRAVLDYIKKHRLYC